MLVCVWGVEGREGEGGRDVSCEVKGPERNHRSMQYQSRTHQWPGLETAPRSVRVEKSKVAVSVESVVATDPAAGPASLSPLTFRLAGACWSRGRAP